MPKVSTVTVLARCPRCAGPMVGSAFERYSVESSCLYCGEYVFTQTPAEFLGEYRQWAGEVVSRAGRPGIAS
jgi:hypothetical protein